jgi:hypothetical protein
MALNLIDLESFTCSYTNFCTENSNNNVINDKLRLSVFLPWCNIVLF